VAVTARRGTACRQGRGEGFRLAPASLSTGPWLLIGSPFQRLRPRHLVVLLGGQRITKGHVEMDRAGTPSQRRGPRTPGQGAPVGDHAVYRFGDADLGEHAYRTAVQTDLVGGLIGPGPT